MKQEVRDGVEVALLSLYVFALPLMSVGTIYVAGMAVIPADWIFALLFVVVVVRDLVGWRRRGDLGTGSRHSPLPPELRTFSLLLAAYASAQLLAVVFSEDIATSAMKFGATLYLVSVAAITARILARTRGFSEIGTAWITGASVTVLASLVGIGLFYAGVREWPSNFFLRSYGSLPPGNYPRIAALFLHYSMLANYLIVAACILWWKWARAPSRKLYPLLLVGVGLSAAFTFSPGIGGLALALGLLAIDQPTPLSAGLTNLKLRRVALLLGCAVAAFALAASLFSPVALLRGEAAPSVRIYIWEDSLDTFLVHPIFGKGLGIAVADVHFRIPDGTLIHYVDAHNVWLNLAASTGVVGLVAMASLVLYLLASATSTEQTNCAGGEPDAATALQRCLGVAILGTWIYHGLFGSFEETRHLWVLLGMAAAVGPTLDQRRHVG